MIGYADLHCDTLTAIPYDQLRQGNGQLSLTTLKQAGCRMQCWAIFLDKEQGDLYNRAMRYADTFDRMVAEYAIPTVRSVKDIEATARADRPAAMLTVEGGEIIEGDLDKLRELHRRGVRMLTLTWNFSNAIGYPNIAYDIFGRHRKELLTHVEDRGLTPFGLQTVRTMNDLGMIVDVSHLGDGGFWDVIRTSTKPVVASHSNARALCGVVRNLTDDMIRALAANGGVMGLNLCPDFLTMDGGDLMDAAVAHVGHILQVGGEDVLALGTDFDGIPSKAPLRTCLDLPALWDRLRAEFGERVVRKMAWDNVERVFRACLPQ